MLRGEGWGVGNGALFWVFGEEVLGGGVGGFLNCGVNGIEDFVAFSLALIAFGLMVEDGLDFSYTLMSVFLVLLFFGFRFIFEVPKLSPCVLRSAIISVGKGALLTDLWWESD